MTQEEVLGEYPGIQQDDILACIAYGSEMTRGRHIDLPVVRDS